MEINYPNLILASNEPSVRLQNTVKNPNSKSLESKLNIIAMYVMFIK